MNGLPGVYPPGIFQFTPLREGRRAYPTTCARVMISIHAPPRGATEEVGQIVGVDKFQFTPLREGRQREVVLSDVAMQFQFTPLREGRHAARFLEKNAEGYFNSRPSARGDEA